jgi:acyl-CoA synthetase (NDP forming)
MSQSADRFERIFHPGRVAIVGVSAEGFGFGRGILLSLRAIGFEGELIPVNPRGGEVDGFRIYRAVEDIPGGIDFAVIAVPARAVPAALESCRKKGAAGAEVLSSGFDELATEEGARLGREIKEIAARGIRVLGPNCFGIYCPASGLTMLPGPDLSREPGNVAFISQSGGMSIDLAHVGKWKGFRFSKVVSFGNGIDLRETELLEYLGDDPDTEIIAMYIEGVEDGRRFLRTLKEVGERKPVLVCKGGLSEAGSRAVESHTASMSGARAIWEAVLRQCNAVPVADLQEMSDALLAFTMLPPGHYRGISVMGGGGALGVAAADAAESYGMTIPRFGDDIRRKIDAHLPKPGSSPANPVDIANPFVSPDALREILLAAAEDARVDLQIMAQLLYHYKSLSLSLGGAPLKDLVPCKRLSEAVAGARDRSGKPVVMVLPNHKRETESMDIEEVLRAARKECIDRHIPVFDELSHAMKAVSNVSNYYATLIRRRM